MSGWPAPLEPLMMYGPVVAGLAALAISPGVHVLLAAVLERRVVRVRQEFAAVVYGDGLLAVAAAVGIALAPGGPPPALAGVFDAAWIPVAAGWIVFGLWQWRAELRTGYYTGAQALSPTKVWHQLGVYPLLGTAVAGAAFSGLAAPLGADSLPRVVAKVVIVGCLAGWVLALLYDRRHPKLGHPPYDWRRLRPAPAPWHPASVTLRHHLGESS